MIRAALVCCTLLLAASSTLAKLPTCLTGAETANAVDSALARFTSQARTAARQRSNFPNEGANLLQLSSPECDPLLDQLETVFFCFSQIGAFSPFAQNNTIEGYQSEFLEPFCGTCGTAFTDIIEVFQVHTCGQFPAFSNYPIEAIIEFEPRAELFCREDPNDCPVSIQWGLLDTFRNEQWCREECEDYFDEFSTLIFELDPIIRPCVRIFCIRDSNGDLCVDDLVREFGENGGDADWPLISDVWIGRMDEFCWIHADCLQAVDAYAVPNLPPNMDGDGGCNCLRDSSFIESWCYFDTDCSNCVDWQKLELPALTFNDTRFESCEIPFFENGTTSAPGSCPPPCADAFQALVANNSFCTGWILNNQDCEMPEEQQAAIRDFFENTCGLALPPYDFETSSQECFQNLTTPEPTEPPIAPCDLGPQVPNSNVPANPVICENWPAGSQCPFFSCIPGFTQIGPDPTCNGDNIWTNDTICQRVSSGFGHLHFLSLDNVLFSYHTTGTIRLWRSEVNELEVQVRTLQPAAVPCEVTLIGMVAIQAADQTISVVGSGPTMEVFINDAPSTLSLGTPTALGSGPNELSITQFESVLAISSKRGAIMTVTRYAMQPDNTMPWLVVTNALLPSEFYGNTEGLLGIYDGNPLNDFTDGRNGTVYPVEFLNQTNGEVRDFGNSWQVDPSESIFGATEDAIAAADPQYQFPPSGPSTLPSCPTEFNTSNMTTGCEDLDEFFYEACLFDVILGGPQFLDDILYQDPCPGTNDAFCSFHGECGNAGCECFPGWVGVDCSERVCPPDCVNSPTSTGECSSAQEGGFCVCQTGFTGTICTESADCSALNDCNTDLGYGQCVDSGICECNAGFGGPRCLPAGDCPQEVDGNLEVRFPPELDETRTEVVFNLDGTADFYITIIVPKQYTAAEFSFEGASDSSGGFDSQSSSANSYWTIDSTSDECNNIFTGLLPWSEFRRSLGGVESTVTPTTTSYRTEVIIVATLPITVTPETKLLQVPDQEFTRRVTLRVPFEITFHTRLSLNNTVIVRSDNLRVEPALLETSVVEIFNDLLNPDLARAELEIVTIVPLPLRLDAFPTISTGNPNLDPLSISEMVYDAADCDVDNAFCTQHWRVELIPSQCTLNGIYTAQWTGFCYDTRNCVHPSPDFTIVDFDITSDSFCGVYQDVTVAGDLELDPFATCNERLFGQISVYNDNNDAQLNSTTILEVLAHPPLANPYIVGLEPRFIEVFEEGVPPAFPLLDFQIEAEAPSEVIFSFLWRGADLRCDVTASVHVVVRVEYQATRDLSLLEMPPNADKKSVKAGESFSQMMLMELDDQTLRMTGRSAIGADPAGGPRGGELGGDTVIISGVSNAVVMGAIAGVVALIAIVIAVAVVLVRKAKKNAHKEIQMYAATPAAPVES